MVWIYLSKPTLDMRSQSTVPMERVACVVNYELRADIQWPIKHQRNSEVFRETLKEPGHFPGDSPELFNGSIIASVSSLRRKSICRPAASNNTELIRLCRIGARWSLSHNRKQSRALRHACRTSRLIRERVSLTLQRGKGRKSQWTRRIDDLELELSSRMDERAIDEHYTRREGRNW